MELLQRLSRHLFLGKKVKMLQLEIYIQLFTFVSLLYSAYTPSHLPGLAIPEQEN